MAQNQADDTRAADLQPVPEDWTVGLAVVAHPDDMEYGAASAVARWTAQGKDIRYVLVTDGEAGIATMPPDQAGPLRREEQIASCAVVGVDQVDFLGLPDGLLAEGLDLRRALSASIRKHRPEVLLSINHRDQWGPSSWNHVDHRVVGRALMDAARDAGNPWVFPEDGDAWNGVRFAAFSGSPAATHAVDVTQHIEAGVESLRCHRVYLENLGGDMADAGAFLRSNAADTGPRLGVELAAGFELVWL
ncbi:MAG: PIG-L deacetylase family protein [Acidimicrobiales bacterium]|nr:PIG-L family deacetylase [Acidimicrobiales bacterium]